MPLFVLLPSPFLGCAVWEPVAAALRAGGGEAALPAFSEPAPASPQDAYDELLAAVPGNRDCVVVAHSNAGYFVPALVAARGAIAAVFVDAALPPFGVTQTLTASDDFYRFLAGKADGTGLLPVWTEWWDENVSSLFPDEASRERVEQQQRRFQLTYFKEPLDVPAGWTSTPCAYLAFGDTYGSELEAVRQRGWPVASMPGDHLEMLRQPAAVAAKLHRLLDQTLEQSAR